MIEAIYVRISTTCVSHRGSKKFACACPRIKTQDSRLVRAIEAFFSNCRR